MTSDSMLSEPQTVEATGTLRFRPPEGQAGQFTGLTVTNLSGYPLLVTSSAQQVQVPAGITAPVPYDGAGQAVMVQAVPGSLGSPGPVTTRWYYAGSQMPAAAVPATTLDTGPADVNVTNATLTVETSGTVDTNVTNATLDITGPVTVAAATAVGSTFGITEAGGTNLVVSAITAGAGVTTIATLVPGISGQNIILHQGIMQYSSVPAGAMAYFLNGSGAVLSCRFFPPSGGAPFIERFAGIPVGDGESLEVSLYGGTSSGGATISLVAIYSVVAS